MWSVDLRKNGASLRGSPHFRFPVGAGTPGKKDGSAASRQKKKPSDRNPDTRRHVEEILKQLPAGKTGRTVPAASWMAWLLSTACLVLAFIFPSYGNDSTDPLYMLQWLPTIIFCCTAAVLFIQGLAGATRR